MWSPSNKPWSLARVLTTLVVAACSSPDRPTGVSHHLVATASADISNANPTSAAGDDKGYLGAYLDGEKVALRYTRLYFCAEPPSSSVGDTDGCEIGAPPTIAPRSGPIGKIYALAPVGFTPDPSTLHCAGGTTCLNHPRMLDISRLGLPVSVATAPPHSHLLEKKQAGWHNTVNIRVLSLDAWNQIAAAKSLAKVRELQQQGSLGRTCPRTCTSSPKSSKRSSATPNAETGRSLRVRCYSRPPEVCRRPK